MMFRGLFIKVEKNMKYSVLLILLLLSVPVFAQTGAKTGMAYMKIGVDSRAAAMGEAYTALANDAAATYWNPAGLALAQSNSAVLMHNAWIQDVSHDFAAVQLFRGTHNIALSLNMMFVSGIELRGERATEEPDGETGAHNVNLAVSYATEITKGWKIGASLKYLYEKYYLESAAGYAFDLGVIKENLLPDISFGAVLQNIGSMAKLRNESTSLPAALRAGVGYRLPISILNHRPLVAADFYYVNDDVTRVGLGFETAMFDNFDLRAGYVLGSETMSLTAGLGVRYGLFNIAYAFVPFDYDLGNSHRFSLSIAFD
jgi:hypothetical protein